MQKKIYIFALLIAVANFVFAEQTLSKGKKDSIFVADTKVSESLITTSKSDKTDKELNRLVDNITPQIESSLSSTRIFQIVERERMKELGLETDFSESGLVGSETTLKQFNTTGAKFALFPKITAYQLKKAVQKYNAIDRQSSSVIISANLQTKIVDVSTGEALADIISITKTATQNYDLSKTGTEISVDMLIADLAKKLSDASAWGLVNMVRPPKILAVTSGQAMVNRGESGELTKGLKVKIYAVEEIEDEDTGAIFNNEVEVGQGLITRSSLKQSYVTLEGENLGVAKGCIVRVVDVPQSVEQSQKGRAESTFGTNPAEEKTEKLTPGSSEKPW
ncbi:MAG: hypothetical protein PF692_12680 [Kiritimatiellae bacterium]|jgi:curli biogenesis system outer membrane secretion channel CsgG|nr:hypothetical protein [Kiritimatiellia bacterium]